MNKKVAIFSILKSSIVLSFCFLSCAQKNDKAQDLSVLSENTQTRVANANGKKIYNSLCLQCHLPSGAGSDGIPPLDGSDWLTTKREAAIRAVKYGLKGEITVNEKTYKGFMPKQNLNSQQVADVMNYIMNSWSNTTTQPVTVAEVEAVGKD